MVGIAINPATAPMQFPVILCLDNVSVFLDGWVNTVTNVIFSLITFEFLQIFILLLQLFNTVIIYFDTVKTYLTDICSFLCTNVLLRIYHLINLEPKHLSSNPLTLSKIFLIYFYF